MTAVIAYEVARYVTGQGILAPLTALLVVQVTVYQTLRTALQRVASVIVGVLLAVALSAALGFTWWSLGITIAAALAVGYALRLGDSALEVPISAMLILSLPSEALVAGRIEATLIGAAVGLLSNLVLSPLRVQPAEEAVDDLGRRLADLLDRVAGDLAAGRGAENAAAWLARARELAAEADRVEDALGQAEESVRLNPRGSQVSADPRVHLRARLEALERATATVRGIARSLNDSAGLGDELSPVRDPEAARRTADVLRELAAVLRSYGRLARSTEVDRAALKADIDQHLTQASDRLNSAAELLRSPDPAKQPGGWPLRGELVSHLDRLRAQLQPPPPRAQGESVRPRRPSPSGGPGTAGPRRVVRWLGRPDSSRR